MNVAESELTDTLLQRGLNETARTAENGGLPLRRNGCLL